MWQRSSPYDPSLNPPQWDNSTKLTFPTSFFDDLWRGLRLSSVSRRPSYSRAETLQKSTYFGSRRPILLFEPLHRPLPYSRPSFDDFSPTPWSLTLSFEPPTPFSLVPLPHLSSFETTLKKQICFDHLTPPYPHRPTDRDPKLLLIYLPDLPRR